MIGTPPIQTSDIFERLSKGQFISEDSGSDEVKDLFNIIELENNYEILRITSYNVCYTKLLRKMENCKN